jgi:signal transduction histidine kinase
VGLLRANPPAADPTHADLPQTGLPHAGLPHAGLPQTGLAQAGLAGLAAVSAAAGLPLRFTVRGTPRALTADTGHAVYRIVQEALTNARRHTRADRVDVLVDYREQRLRVLVSDDGPPSGAAAGAGAGLRGMCERAALLGGTLHAGPRPDKGYQVEAKLPA